MKQDVDRLRIKDDLKGAVDAAIARRLADLESLVTELLSSHPHEARVRSLMEEIGLTYTEDRMEQMAEVLMAVEASPVGDHC